MKSWEFERMWREEAREEGLAEGLAEGKIQDILDLLGELGAVPESLSEKISQERDTETLSQWVKLAAKAVSFSEFEKKLEM